jgi:hypothetical protein
MMFSLVWFNCVEVYAAEATFAASRTAEALLKRVVADSNA